MCGIRFSFEADADVWRLGRVIAGIHQVAARVPDSERLLNEPIGEVTG